MLVRMLSKLNRNDNEISELLHGVLSDCPSEDNEVSSSDSGSDIQTQRAHKRPAPLDISSESTDSSYDSNSGDPLTDINILPYLEPFEGIPGIRVFKFHEIWRMVSKDMTFFVNACIRLKIPH
ncbi:hypothetical protein C0J52_18201 [Blattella germanica]|nr:hypothetical protein C0J52_18201 [Blattella germanica]